MIPSEPSPTGDHLAAWQSGDSWVDHSSGAAAAYHSSSLNSRSGPTAAAAASAAANPSSRYLTHHRHQILDWENAMLLAAQHSDMPSSATTNNAQDSVYDHVASEYNKATSMSPIQADHLHAFSHARLYDNLLSPQVTLSANSGSFANNNAWALLNTVCSRTVSAGTLQQEPCFLQQAAAAQFNGYDTLNGADGLGDLGSLGAAAATSLYADSLRSGAATGCGVLTSFDQRRLDDIMKRELYTTHADFNTSRLGLNLGGRTYFPADDFAFGRWGKRFKHNSPGCMLQPAPLCQAEGCKADLSMAKHYHRRHKVCEYHSKAATVHIGNQTQRFCQQCSRFHVLDEFDDGKRSCRKRLADHNRRRRKPQPTPISSAATSAGALAAETASNTTEAQGQRGDGDQNENATEQETCKEPTNSQEAATGGSDSCNEASVSGATSGKGSPTVETEDHPKPASISIPLGSWSASHKGPDSGRTQENEQNIHDQSNDLTVRSRSSFTLNCSGHGNDMAIVSPERSHIAANLSLGGAADILDVKPAHPPVQVSVVDACSLASRRHSVVMPWLQASNKKLHHNMKGRPYEEQRRSDAAANEAADEHAQYSSFKTVPSPDFNDSNGTRGSWMNMKGLAGLTGADSSTDDVLLSPRYTDGDSEAGGHEVLRLLSDERKLMTADKKGPLQGGPGNGIGTLAFLDQTLVQSGFARSDQHPCVLRFSNLQDSNADRQRAPTSLRHGPSTNVAFDSHSNIL